MDKQTDGEALAAAETREAQRRSWATGELMLRRPDMTRADAEAIVAKAAADLRIAEQCPACAGIGAVPVTDDEAEDVLVGRFVDCGACLGSGRR